MAELINITTDQEGQLWLSQQPAGRPPPRIIPNFDNPSNLDAAVFSIIILFCSIAVLATIIRIYTKIFFIRSLAYEDYAVALASVSPFFPPSDGNTLKNLDHWTNINAIVLAPEEFLVGLSILLQYLRIFVPHRRNAQVMYHAIYALIASNFAFYLARFVGLIAFCVPREKLWKPWITGGHCNNADTWFLASALCNAISDFGILILPIPCIWTLQLPKKKKVMVSAIFATGFL
ncbi:MAG: hypothetical protein Q9228_004316 [Teloschistes exilis]